MRTAIGKLKAFWQACGSQVEIMDAAHHDLVLAVTSHLPHLIAFNIVTTAADLEEVTKSEVIKYSAGGFRDFTRIAASDPVMWRDVFLNNKDAVLEMLGRFSEDLSALQRAIRWNDGDALMTLFTRARGIRRDIIAAGQDTASADFGRHAGEAPPIQRNGRQLAEPEGAEIEAAVLGAQIDAGCAAGRRRQGGSGTQGLPRVSSGSMTSLACKAIEQLAQIGDVEGDAAVKPRRRVEADPALAANENIAARHIETVDIHSGIFNRARIGDLDGQAILG